MDIPLSEVYSSIILLDLVNIIFILIPKLKKSFYSLIETASIQNEEDKISYISERKSELKNIFINLLFKRFIIINDLYKFTSNIELKDVVFDKFLWSKAYRIFAERIIIEQNKKYYIFDFVITKFRDFEKKINNYMNIFSKNNNC